jgi:mRNA-degrading endonuclease RelE of RelBE toxin-antitoxin system
MPIRFTERFARQYEALPKTIQKKVDKTLFLLELDYRHPGLRSHPLGGVKGIFEAYVDAKYRITFERRGEIFIMRNVDNHDECLKNP